jgi:hypothetical protein
MQGIKIDMVKQVTSRTFYAKEVEMNGRQELVEVGISIMRMKEVVQKEWRHCMEVDLKLVNMDSTEVEELTGEELIQRFEVLRDCWLQLAPGLVKE